ncbi:MAG: metal-dependent hydrolase [Clostridia bacterium]|nr:metal-dependent hydrolase [Clostridia bacterium]
MNGTCHLAFGTAVGVTAAVNLDLITDAFPNIAFSSEMGTLFVLGGIIGSLIPDIDAPQSYVGKLCSPISRLFGKIHSLQGKEEWQHRGIMHDAIIYIVGLILSYLYFTPLVGLFLGSLTHVFLDMFNPMGIPFLFGVKRLRIAKIRSSDKKATVLTAICTALVLTVGVGGRFVPLTG